MLRSTRVPSVLLSLALVACGASRSPVPLVGTSNDLSPLAGDWAGDYSSAASGRSGSISFTLRAATDSAFGDVTMIPAGLGRPLDRAAALALRLACDRWYSEVGTLDRLEAENLARAIQRVVDIAVDILLAELVV